MGFEMIICGVGLVLVDFFIDGIEWMLLVVLFFVGLLLSLFLSDKRVLLLFIVVGIIFCGFFFFVDKCWMIRISVFVFVLCIVLGFMVEKLKK